MQRGLLKGRDWKRESSRRLLYVGVGPSRERERGEEGGERGEGELEVFLLWFGGGRRGLEGEKGREETRELEQSAFFSFAPATFY